MKTRHHSEEHKRKIGESNKGKTTWMKGKHHSEESKRKMSETRNKRFSEGMKHPMLGKHHSEETKMKMRESAINCIERQVFDGPSMYPRLGKYETSILDYLETIWGYNILRQHQVNGFFLDGYCPVLNLAIEIDESFHNKQTEKDQLRQENIEKEINCQFLRINIGGI